MNFQSDVVVSWVQQNPITTAIAAAAVVLTVAAVVATARTWRRRDLVAKQVIGFAVVQAGVSFIIITGVYEFFEGLLDMPVPEAAVLAVFLEAATWGAVGFIYGHGKSMVTGADGTESPALGFGKAGPFFWFSVAGGGVIAVIGSGSIQVAVGRSVIVGIGAYMWYLQLLRFTRPKPKQDTQWNWSLTKLLIVIGARRPTDKDIRNDHREWQIRRLARAIRWTNSGRPWSWFGKRVLRRRGEETAPDVIAEARARWATTYVLVEHVAHDSEVMAGIISMIKEASKVAATPPPALPEPPRWTVDTEQIVRDAREALLARTDGQVSPPALPPGRTPEPADRADGQSENAETVVARAPGAPSGLAAANWLPLSELPGLPAIPPDQVCKCHSTPDPAKWCGKTLAFHVQRRGRYIRQIMTKRPDWAVGERVGRKAVEVMTDANSAGIFNEIGWVFDQLRDLAAAERAASDAAASAAAVVTDP